jgi:DNA-binding transcriptional LysR family regulator
MTWIHWHLTVSVIPSFASGWLIPRLGAFYRQYPELTVRLQTSSELDAFAEGGVDLCIRFGGARYEGLRSDWFMDDWIYPVCHPQHPSISALKEPKDLEFCQVLVDSDSDVTWDQWFRSEGLTIDCPRYFTAYDASHYLVEGVLAGQGVGLLRHSLVAELVTNGSIVRLFGRVLKLNYRYFFCAPAHHLQCNKVQVFVSWLKMAIDEFNRKNSL